MQYGFQGLIMSRLFIIIFLTFSGLTHAGLPKIVLSGEAGETLDGKDFDTSSLKGKTFLLVHLDPDQRDLNDKAQKALEAAKLSGPKYGSVVLINAKSSWIPNGILKTALKLSQKKFADTTYVLDYSKTFVDQWNFKDNSSSFMVINADGLPIFRREGKLSDADIAELLSLIKANI
jgi:uncharacterized protein